MKKTVLKLAVVIVAIVFGYAAYSPSTAKGQNSIVVVSDGSDDVLVGGDSISLSEKTELLQMLNTLKSIKLDTEFFENRLFKSLIDFSVELVPEPVGRPNPFLPMGVGRRSVETPDGEESPDDDQSVDDTNG